MTLYLIGGGALLILFVMWKYGSLIKDRFRMKSAQREAAIHADINKKNKEIDKEAEGKYNEIKSIDQNKMVDWLNNRFKKNKDGKK